MWKVAKRSKFSITRVISSIIKGKELNVSRLSGNAAVSPAASAEYIPPSHIKVGLKPSHRANTPQTFASSKKKNFDHYRFNYGFSGYAHHGDSFKPVVTSLTDLTDSTSSISLLPRRTLHSNPIETLSIKNGDDAMIVSPNIVGVADGVSGWSGAHANSGLFARSFLENISKYFTKLSYENYKKLNQITEKELSQSLDKAYRDSIKVMENEHFKGSSTLLIGMIFDKHLKIMNIGDSKIFIIREGKCISSNTEQYISNLCPEQVGTTESDKLPSSVVEFLDFDIRENDLILVCSDGVTDNLYPDEIMEIIASKANNDHSNLQEIANWLLYKTRGVAFDNHCICPYVEKVSEISNQFITGGKVDDISICISKVVLNN